MKKNLENLKQRIRQLCADKRWDNVISLCTQVIDSDQEPHAKAIAYFWRGLAYNLIGNFTKAIADFTQAIGLDPDHAEAYSGRGFARYAKGTPDETITDLTRVIELAPDHAEAYFGRGLAHIINKNFLDASKDFVKADNCDPVMKTVLKTKIPEIYVADKIADIYNNHAEEDSVRAFELYSRLSEATSDIRKELFHGPANGKEVAHYTSLHALKSVADQGRFRLYNTAYMNDPEEGRAFFEIMKNLPEIDINIEGSFYQDSQLHPSPAYIGSFVINENKRESKDELFLWRTYGKHDGQEAAGACLIFKHEGTVFAEKCSLQTGAMEQLQSELLMSTSDLQNPEGRQPRKPDLYEIVYSEEETNQGLSEELKKLAESLKQIKEHIEKEEDVGKKRELKKLARDLLDTIRFLFKARHYREEKEVRVVQVRYYDEEKTTQGPDNIQVDTEHVPHRFYLETHENFRFSEVILGPNARDIPEWKRWLKEHDIKAEQSNIPYGKPYS